MSKDVSRRNPGQRGASAVVPSWLLENQTCERCGAEETTVDPDGICRDCREHEDGASQGWWDLESGG